ncbi:MAG TPA: hypothetical protein VN785_10410 [Candidatus Angelobacter sp.]|nr:hypothetical protein [Candidatus Angelobacter sp.]
MNFLLEISCYIMKLTDPRDYRQSALTAASAAELFMQVLSTGIFAEELQPPGGFFLVQPVPIVV